MASIFSAVFILGGVFGNKILTAHYNFYRSKLEIETLTHNLSRQLRGSAQWMDTDPGTNYHLKFRKVEIRATAS